MSKCSYKHVFNGVLTTLNFYNYFLADPLGNCDLKVIGKTAFNAEFLTVANTLLVCPIKYVLTSSQGLK